MKNKISENYRHLPMFKHGREPHKVWKFLAAFFQGYCDVRLSCGVWHSWKSAYLWATGYFLSKRKNPIIYPIEKRTFE